MARPALRVRGAVRGSWGPEGALFAVNRRAPSSRTCARAGSGDFPVNPGDLPVTSRRRAGGFAGASGRRSRRGRGRAARRSSRAPRRAPGAAVSSCPPSGLGGCAGGPRAPSRLRVDSWLIPPGSCLEPPPMSLEPFWSRADAAPRNRRRTPERGPMEGPTSRRWPGRPAGGRAAPARGRAASASRAPCFHARLTAHAPTAHAVSRPLVSRKPPVSYIRVPILRRGDDFVAGLGVSNGIGM